jgi:hypothetical protein
MPPLAAAPMLQPEAPADSNVSVIPYGSTLAVSIVCQDGAEAFYTEQV